MTSCDEGIPGLRTRDHWIEAPLDHAAPDASQRIAVYAREVVGPEHADVTPLPWLLFLQGGPGGMSPRPLNRSGWLDEALTRYRVLLMDQRGTGRSTPVGPHLLEAHADPAEVAQYLGHLRADAIVRDAELFRRELIGERRWSTLGQSYGGFCTFSYLSIAPHALDHCVVTGGIPPIGLSALELYRRTWPRVVAKNKEYFRRFAADRARLDDIVARGVGAPLPDGSELTLERLLSLGISFGGADGFASTHYLLELALGEQGLTANFQRELCSRTDDSGGPLYALLQEAIYCEGSASQWAATRARAEISELSPDAEHRLFTGEMKERWNFTDIPAMRPYLEVADALHERADWPALYDVDVLRDNTVPVAAAVYYDDMYVDFDASMDVVRQIPQVRAWVTNQYEHDGLRADSGVFSRLDRMARGLE